MRADSKIQEYYGRGLIDKGLELLNLASLSLRPDPTRSQVQATIKQLDLAGAIITRGQEVLRSKYNMTNFLLIDLCESFPKGSEPRWTDLTKRWQFGFIAFKKLLAGWTDEGLVSVTGGRVIPTTKARDLAKTLEDIV